MGGVMMEGLSGGPQTMAMGGGATGTQRVQIRGLRITNGLLGQAGNRRKQSLVPVSQAWKHGSVSKDSCSEATL